MPRCSGDFIPWKNRRAYRLSNGSIELTVLLYGGHIAALHICGSPSNALWEAPWATIDPPTSLSTQQAALYGEGPVGKLLCGYTGHALALGYFGMPSPAEAEQGLSLHGEAATTEWNIVFANPDDRSARLAMEVALPITGLHFRREILLLADTFSARITESVTNVTGSNIKFQWVQHAAFGEPHFKSGEAALFLSGTRGLTWPEGYEGYELLANNAEYRWPYAPSTNRELIDISQPFVKEGTGFVAGVLTDSGREDAFAAVLNRRHHLVAGYRFDRKIFPWIALWEENCARQYAPWNGSTRARGVEFGTSPMPLGLDHARQMGSLFDTPVLTTLAAKSSRQTQYDLFLGPCPAHWTQIKDVQQSGDNVLVQGDGGEEIKLGRADG